MKYEEKSMAIHSPGRSFGIAAHVTIFDEQLQLRGNL